MGEASDHDLLARCRTGDEEAWRLLVERYAALILSVPRRYGLKAAVAEDVFGEVCLALVRSLRDLRDPQALPKWLIRTAARATWEAARKAKPRIPPDLPPLTGAAPPEEFVMLVEDEQIVREALLQVPERCRRLLDLLYFRTPTPSYDEVARQLGVPRGSLGPTRARCLDKLRRHLEPRLGGDVSRPDKAPPRR